MVVIYVDRQPADTVLYRSQTPLVDLAWIVSMLACEGDISLASSIALCPNCKDEAGCHSITYMYFIADSVTHVFQTLPSRVYYSSFHTYSRSSPSGKAAGEEVPMEGNPAYGDVNIYHTVKEPKEN